MTEPTPVQTTGRNSSIALTLFAVYVVFYAGFVLLAALRPEWMGMPTPFGSVNLAIMYGMGLILAALVLAIIYMLARRGSRAE